MRTAWRQFLAPLTPGVRVLLLILIISYIIAVAGTLSGLYNLYEPLGLNGPDFRAGKIWQIGSYVLLPATFFDFLFNWVMVLFLGSCLEKLWSRRQLWLCCLVSTVCAGLAKVLIEPSSHRSMVGTGPVVFGLLAAWGYVFKYEKVLLYFIWEMTNRQAAVLMTGVSVLLMLPCCGPKNVAIMLVGGLGTLIFLWGQSKVIGARASRPVISERMGRLEL
jgi:membrane associated rhomboid family serine protease